MQIPRWLQFSIVGVVLITALQLIGNWSVCSFLYGPRLLRLHTQTDGKVILGDSCEGAGDKAAAGLSALLATLLGLASQPPRQE
jgi:hypothetical protein